jgi:outer membrane protein TolC
MSRSCFLLLFLAFCGTAQVIGQSLNLDYYLRLGIANNPQLNDYRNQAGSSAVDSLKVRAGRKPQVNLMGQVLIAPVINGYGYDAAVTNSGNYEFLMGVNQNLFNKKILAPQYESARLQGMTANNSAVTTEHDLKRSITQQYITAYADIVQIEYAKSTFQLLQEENNFLLQFVERGVYKPFDYSSFQILLKAQEIYLHQQEFQYRSDVYALNILCGITDTTTPVLQAPVLAGASLVGFQSSRFHTSFHLDSLTIQNKRMLAGVNYKPHLSWFADGGLLTSQPATFYQNFGTSFGLNFSMPIYDGKQKKLEYKKLDLSENTRTGYEDYFRKQYTAELNSLLDELEETHILITDTRKQLSMAEEVVRLGKTQLNAGTLPVTDFILAVRNIQDIHNSLNQLEVKQQLLTNEFNYWNW